MGDGGANVLDGGTGADVLSGFGGNDTYMVDSATDKVMEAADGGIDAVMAAVTFALGSGQSIEALSTTSVVGTTAINLTGNTLAQTITGNAGANILGDGGAGAADTLSGMGGNDTYMVANAGDQVMEAANGGADTVMAAVTFALGAGQSIETLSTTSITGTAAIGLTGNALAQTITGNAGANILGDGGAGAADALSGMGGNDTYMVANAGDQVMEASNGGTDTVMSGLSFTLGAGQSIEALATTSAAGTGAINLTGNALAQTISGNAGVNTLSDGGTGAADTLSGMGGNDTYMVANTADKVIEAVDGGTDTVMTAVAFALGAGQSIETLSTTSVAGTTAIDLTGNALAQAITGNAGVNVLGDGGAGAADTLRGMGGNDTYLVANAGDQVMEASNGGTDAVMAAVSFALAASQSIEALATTSAAGTAAIDLTGNTLAQAITGNAGGNALGDSGPGAADTLSGLGGNDTYMVANAGDQVIEASNGGTDRVMAALSFALAAGQSIEALSTTSDAGTATINLTGNALAQAIIGNAGINVLGDGGLGAADMLSGLGGNDRYVVNNKADQVIEADGGGIDTVMASVTFALAAGQSIEYLSASSTTDTAAIGLTGNELAQVITGNAGVDTLDDGGVGGADTLRGLGGNDRYVVANTADLVVEAADGGSDVVLASTSFALGKGQSIETLATTLATSTTALDLTGNALAQAIMGNAGTNTLSDGGLGAADTLKGLGGDDTYVVANAGDLVVEAANGGTDAVATSVSFALTASQSIESLSTTNAAGTAAIGLTGNGLAQSIIGNNGSNVISGHGGNDVMTGNGGHDTFVFDVAPNTTSNDPQITDFTVAGASADMIALSHAIYSGLSTGALSPSAFTTGAAATTADQHVIYNAGTGALLYDSDGSGSAAATQFAKLSSGLALSAGQFQVVG